MKKILLFAAFLAFTFSYLADAQDFTNKESTLSPEELLLKKYPNQGRSILNKEKYLVVENLRNSKRKRYYIGDTFGFRTKDNLFFQDTIEALTDSTFTIVTFNEATNRHEYRDFRLDEVVRVYKKHVRKGFRWGISGATFAPFLYDWGFYNIPPWNNPNTLKIAAFQALVIAYYNSDKLFRSHKITSNYRLRVFQYF